MAEVIHFSLKKLAMELSSHKVQIRISPGLPMVRIDFVLMDQVMTNLLLNAALYTPAGSDILVEGITLENEIAIRVADEGPGLPEQELERIFDKFYRVPGSPAGGTGVGLSIVKGFVEAQGGRVHAANRDAGGAMFTVFLPRESQPEIPVEP